MVDFRRRAVILSSAALTIMMGCQTAKKVELPASSLSAPTDGQKIFGDWYALGSGCKANATQPGDVTVAISQESVSGTIHSPKLELTYANYSLDSVNGNPKNSINFARQCGFRIAFNPPPSRRIKSISATGVVIASKSAPIELSLGWDLKVGNPTVASRVEIFKAGESFESRTIPFYASTKLPPAVSLANRACGGGTVIGLDQTFIAMRKALSDKVFVKLEGQAKVTLEVELEDCTPGK